MGITIRPSIRKYFEAHPGITVYRSDVLDFVEKEMGGRKSSDQGVTNAIRELAESGGMAIEELDRANSWIYRPNATAAPSKDLVKKPSREIFERVHVTKQGNWILEGTDGEVTLVKPLDL